MLIKDAKKKLYGYEELKPITIKLAFNLISEKKITI